MFMQEFPKMIIHYKIMDVVNRLLKIEFCSIIFYIFAKISYDMRKLLSMFFFSVCTMLACDTYNHPSIPYRKVDFTIYPNDVMYYKLNTYGGYEYFTGGVNGIVVYRLDEWTFHAYDRACPYDWDAHESWIKVHPNGIMLIDSVCGSVFNILDGNVISGPARWPLRKYNTRYDGQSLRVYG